MEVSGHYGPPDRRAGLCAKSLRLFGKNTHAASSSGVASEGRSPSTQRAAKPQFAPAMLVPDRDRRRRYMSEKQKGGP
jgi:hypothetical protein